MAAANLTSTCSRSPSALVRYPLLVARPLSLLPFVARGPYCRRARHSSRFCLPLVPHPRVPSLPSSRATTAPLSRASSPPHARLSAFCYSPSPFPFTKFVSSLPSSSSLSLHSLYNLPLSSASYLTSAAAAGCCFRLVAVPLSTPLPSIKTLRHTICPFTLLSSLPTFPSPSCSLLRLSPLSLCRSWLLTLSRCRAPSHTFPPPLISPLSGAAADNSALIPPPLISPLSGAAADYSALIPPPLISPLSGAAADYSALIPPPLISPLSGATADYSAHIPPPLISPLSGAAADCPAHIPPPLMSSLSGTTADYTALFLRLLFLPSAA
ncbi:unnamed protein product [Closterium sp. NIES-65]|nr:unnamed protein product [Closterium sp. NIES-65]